MILGHPPSHQMASVGSAGRATLDDMFRRALARHPDAVALVDPPDRETVAGGSPRRLTFAQADRMVSIIAARLRSLGLQTDQVVGFQTGNTVEAVLTLLGILRAGMIAAPIPVLWRQGEAVTALSAVGARALIAGGRVGEVDLPELAMHIAAEVFPIRYVCGFGRPVPDGVVPFDDLFVADRAEPAPAIERTGNPAMHVAVVTWDVGPDGLVPVARTHFELMSAALSIVLESRIEQGARVLSSLPPTSFAGIAATLVPWLLVGGTLLLHHAFDAATLAGQCETERPGYAIVPGPIAARLAEAGILTHRHGLKAVLAIWRTPERLAGAPLWRDDAPGITDIQVFGEAGLVVARRDSSGQPAPVGFGPLTVPRGEAGGILVAEITRTATGTVAMRGPMAPRFAYPPGAERGEAPFFRVDDDGYVDTGYVCRVDPGTLAMVVTGPPPGIVGVGGYRFTLRDLQDAAARIDPDSTLAVLPDMLTGHRLAGGATGRAAMQEALAARGLNPLVVGAFKDRRMIDEPTA